MAEGDLTKEKYIDLIEIVDTWNVCVREATKIMEEKADGSKKELSRELNRHVLAPFVSQKKDGKWEHTPKDISKENAKVQKFCEVAWDDDTKAAYKTFTESNSLL